MDMICAVKDMKVIQGLDNISKTKVRGIFALLKNCQCLSTKAEEGESVQLFLADGIHSFKDFKQKHDHFFEHCMEQLHVVLPPEVKTYLVWSWDNSTFMKGKLAEIKKLEGIIEEFFINGTTTVVTNNTPLTYHREEHIIHEGKFIFFNSVRSIFLLLNFFYRDFSAKQ
jgi:hypothetical protein